MIVVGIDPGVTGAVAILTDDAALVYPMPTLTYSETGFVKRAVDCGALAGILRVLPTCRVFVEKVSAFPGQGVASMFSLGMSVWGCAGVAAGLGMPVTMVQPQAWKRHFDLTKEKNLSLDLARTLYPMVNLKLKKDHNKAEALLIARYGREMTK